MAKTTSNIKSLEVETGFGEIVETGKKLITFIQHINLMMPSYLKNYFDEYINYRMKILKGEKPIKNSSWAEWKEFADNIDNATPIDLNETAIEKMKRIQRLEADDEAWFRYYFTIYYTSEPADFHLKSTKKSNEQCRVLTPCVRGFS